MLRRLILAAVAAAGILLPSAAPAQAQSDVGLRFGVTDDPDVFFGGVQFQSLLSGGRTARIYFAPGVDFGLGDDADFFMIRGSAHFEFHFPLSRRRTSLFPLVGLGLAYYNFDCGDLADCDETEVTLDIGGGFQFDRFRFSLWTSIDYPDINAAFGVMF